MWLVFRLFYCIFGPGPLVGQAHHGYMDRSLRIFFQILGPPRPPPGDEWQAGWGLVRQPGPPLTTPDIFLKSRIPVTREVGRMRPGLERLTGDVLDATDFPSALAPLPNMTTI